MVTLEAIMARVCSENCTLMLALNFWHASFMVSQKTLYENILHQISAALCLPADFDHVQHVGFIRAFQQLPKNRLVQSEDGLIND